MSERQGLDRFEAGDATLPDARGVGEGSADSGARGDRDARATPTAGATGSDAGATPTAPGTDAAIDATSEGGAIPGYEDLESDPSV